MQVYTDTHPHTDHSPCSSTFFHIPQTFKGITFSKTNSKSIQIKFTKLKFNYIIQLRLDDNRQVSLITLRVTIGNVQRGYIIIIIIIITRMVHWLLFLKLCVNVCVHKTQRNCWLRAKHQEYPTEENLKTNKKISTILQVTMARWEGAWNKVFILFLQGIYMLQDHC